MAKSFSAKDAAVLYDRHKKMLEWLDTIDKAPVEYESRIRRHVGAALDREVWERLKAMPVDELNRNKEGIRISALKEGGYENLAQFEGRSRRQIESVNGVGENSSDLILKSLNAIKKEVRSNVKLKMDPDNPTPETTTLAYMYLVYVKAGAYAAQAHELLEKYNASISAALIDLLPATSPINWFLAFGSKKTDAEGAFEYLLQKNTQGYDDAVIALVTAYKQLRDIDSASAWEFYKQNTVNFYTVMERVASDAFGKSDDVKYYGLPEDIGEEIEAVSLYPQGLKAELRNYQQWGVKYILHQEKVLLGDEMGLGKTVQAIAAMVSLSNTGETHFIVVCPAAVLINWIKEVEKFSTLKTYKVHGKDGEDAWVNWRRYGGVAVTTYETTARLVLDDKADVGLMVVDEAHYIKNKETRRSVNVRELAARAERLLFMTGTALENRVDEMVSLIEALNPDLAKEIQNMSSMRHAPEFKRKVATCYLRRKREQVAGELPDLIEKEDWIQLNEVEKAIYTETLLSHNIADVRRVSWNVPDITASGKAQRLLEIVEMAKDEDRKVIVFTFFKTIAESVAAILGEKCVGIIDGSTSPESRQKSVDALNAAPGGSVLVAQIVAGGTGLNIQAASVVILCEPQYKPSLENQAISRAYRMGQSRSVLVHRLLADDTFDERLLEIVKSKQKIFDAFADESAAAEKMDVDEAALNDLIQEEINRINSELPDAKHEE